MNKINKMDTRGHKDLGSHLVELFELLCVFATRMKIDIHQAMVFKYPGVCAYCVKSICECSSQLFRPEKASDQTLGPFRIKAISWNIETFVKSDLALYPCDGTDHTIGKKWRHFLSEGIEFAQEVLVHSEESSTKDLGSEIADLCEKIINLCGVLKIDIVTLWNERYSKFVCKTTSAA